MRGRSVFSCRASVSSRQMASEAARVLVAVQARDAVATPQLLVHLIFVGNVVDEPRAQRVFRHERPIVDERADLLVVLLPAVRDAAHDLLVQIAVERLVHLAMRRRVAFLRERVDRCLVGADVVQIGRRADLVERAAQKELVRGHAHQIQRAGRHEKHLVGGRCEVVLAIAAVFEIGEDRLSRLPEVDHRLANLLHFAPERRCEPGRFQQHRADARVDLRLAKVVDDAPHRRPFPPAQVSDHVGRFHLAQIAPDVQDQRGPRGDGGFASEQHVQQREAGDRDEDGDTENREEDGESTTSHRTLTSVSYQLSAISYLLSAICYQISAGSPQLRAQ